MPFADPSPTQYDVCFRFLGIPIRIQPFFWLVAILLGRDTPEPASMLVWVAAMLASIIVHELGHALLQRHWGGDPRIVLYGFGGLASAAGVRLTPWRQIAISLAGPAAGLLLSLFAYGLWNLIGTPVLLPKKIGDFATYELLLFFVCWIGLFWGIFNLFPIYPLDGGQVSREICTLIMPPRRGIVVSLWLSIVTCAALAAYVVFFAFSLWNLVLLIALAVNNYQTLEAYQNTGSSYR